MSKYIGPLLRKYSILEAVRNDKNAGVNQTYIHIAKSFMIKIKWK